MDRTIVHFEIPANDPSKLQAFYKDLFDWKFESVPGDYWLIQTKAKEEDTGVNGGMMKKNDSNQIAVNYVGVESVTTFTDKISKLGGKIIVPKTEVQDHGVFAIALDPEGNPFGIWESTQK